MRRRRALPLERAEDAVEVAHVDPLVRHQRRQLLEELVAVAWVIAEDEEDSRLGETLESRMDVPAPGADLRRQRAPRGSLLRPVMLGCALQCKTQLCRA